MGEAIGKLRPGTGRGLLIIDDGLKSVATSENLSSLISFLSFLFLFVSPCLCGDISLGALVHDSTMKRNRGLVER